MSVINLNSSNYENEVTKSDKPVLIDFKAAWCGPCRQLTPVIEEIASERDNIKVCVVDVEEEAELAQKFGIKSIPTLIFMKNGEPVNRKIGVVTKEEILSLL